MWEHKICGFMAHVDLKKMTPPTCRTPTCVGRPYQICQIEIPYTCKLLFQELVSMYETVMIYTKLDPEKDGARG